ncbi:unnamed protein product [Peronospora belbahrii]|uniref:Uncharacterized protein n=1 Tax=Peronospora belbahrii TaxID=622444 RepID=A0AAU9KRS1_9STRA|nr:unnamed protein product [Peronospora belbahrii]
MSSKVYYSFYIRCHVKVEGNFFTTGESTQGESATVIAKEVFMCSSRLHVFESSDGLGSGCHWFDDTNSRNLSTSSQIVKRI